MKILVTGTSGMLGSAVTKELKRFDLFYELIETGPSSERDLTDLKLTEDFVKHHDPDVVVHLAALTSLKKCKEKPDLAKSLHIDTTRILSKNCRRMIYVSTDSVFDGYSCVPYSEGSSANPLNTYAKTKLAGEAAAESNNKNFLVVRTNIFGSKPGMLADWALESHKNMQQINGYVNVKFNPVYAGDLATAIRLLIDSEQTGIINIASDFCLSKYEFLTLLYGQFNIDPLVINPETCGSSMDDIKRPKYTCLKTGRFEKEFGYVCSLTDGLKKLHQEYTENGKWNLV